MTSSLVGSEMCIRDRPSPLLGLRGGSPQAQKGGTPKHHRDKHPLRPCACSSARPCGGLGVVHVHEERRPQSRTRSHQL
eukprot:6695757-Prorocentrum_lima.AAC.1